MSEFAPPTVPDEPAVSAPGAMTEQEIDSILADFRSWLMQLTAPGPEQLPETGPAEEGPDLATVVGQFIALRHEVNLQTRATRAQQEQNADTLQRLSDALQLAERQRQSVKDADQQTQAGLLRPVLQTLLETWDALALARREVQRSQENLMVLLEPVNFPDQPPSLPFLARWLGASKKFDQVWNTFRDQQNNQVRQIADRARQLLSSIVTGYTMSLQRLDRALDQHGLVRIESLGKPFDPETMEAVEVLHQQGRQGTEIIEEVRPGYLWQGRVFRFAMVRVASGA